MQAMISSHASFYNALLPISDANRALTRLGEDETVGRLLSVIQRFGLQDRLGVRLLHKHNDISADEVMYESSSFDSEGFAITTTAIVQSHINSMAPNSWQFVEGRYVPVEFSDPILVSDPHLEIDAFNGLLQEISNVLIETGTANLLGLCLHYSSYVEDHDPFERSAFLEKTDFDNRSNVVRYVSLNDVAFMNSAKTKWRAVQAVDAEGNLVWTTACNCFCSVFPQGGHQGTTTHRYTP